MLNDSTQKVLGALAVMMWIISLGLTLQTAPAARLPKATWSERISWRGARKAAAQRAAVLRTKEGRLTSPLSATAREYLQRSDHLTLASLRGIKFKMALPAVLSIFAGLALMRRAEHSLSGAWKGAATLLSIAPAFSSIVIFLLAGVPAQSRWTTSIIGTHAYESLVKLIDPFRMGVEPSSIRPFEPPHTEAVRSLENLATALERYALQRALPDGRTPMPDVVQEYATAAALVRKLRGGVELDGETGRIAARDEIQHLVECLADNRIRDIARQSANELEPIQADFVEAHRRRRRDRRQLITLVIFTAVAAGTIAILALAGLAEAALAAIATALVALWVKTLRLQEDSSPRSPGGES
ncbi:hypothetical protein ACFV4F_36760 [Kitasatospora sp. NPDC059722]|uniref:hypothetical protein n=1 Tax=Kitasatospora sp. NPDC059722 TaxID=3346925 RepID=UPI0036865CF0